MTVSPKDSAVRKPDKTRWLYVAVLVAVAAGIAFGLIAPKTAVELKPLGDSFVSLVKMMISPIIFCTIVLGIGSVRDATKVGRVGGIALGYFLVMSTFALAIGLVVGNIVHPGSDLHLTTAAAKAGSKAAASAARPASGGSCRRSSPPPCSHR